MLGPPARRHPPGRHLPARLWWVVAASLLALPSCTTTFNDLKPEQRQQQCRFMRPPLEAITVTNYRRLGPSLPELSVRPVSVDLQVTVDGAGTIQAGKLIDGRADVISLQRLRGLRLLDGIGKALCVDISLNTLVPYQTFQSPGWRMDVILRGGDRLTCPPEQKRI